MPYVDDFRINSSTMEAPATRAEAITPNDSADLGFATRALYVGVTGNVRLLMLGGETLTFVGVQGGSILPVRAIRVYATDTTATDIIGLR